jgi:hypothetical protein
VVKAGNHYLKRTSAKGLPFVGTCVFCGKERLPLSAMTQPCPSVKKNEPTKDGDPEK